MHEVQLRPECSETCPVAGWFVTQAYKLQPRFPTREQLLFLVRHIGAISFGKEVRLVLFATFGARNTSWAAFS